MTQIRVGLICGPGQTSNLVTALAAHPGIAVVWNTMLDGEPAAVAMANTAIKDSDIDAIIVAAAPDDALPLTCSALTAGRHVMTDRPIGTSVEDLIELRRIEAASPASVLKLGFPARHHGSVTAAREIARSGSLGEVVFLRGIYGLAGGAAGLMQPGLELLDLVHVFAGPSQEIQAIMTAPEWPGQPAGENIQALLRTFTGTTTSLHISASQWRETFRLEIGFEKGYLWLDGLRTPTGNLGPEMLICGRVQYDGAENPLANPAEEITEFTEDVAAQAGIQEFVDAIAGRTPIANGTSTQAFDAMNDYQRICAAAAMIA